MDKEIIKQIGLSDNEAEIYLLLLQLGESSASQVAEKSEISRPHIYDTLAKLIEKGLASYVIKQGRRYYKPADPDSLLELIKTKEMSLQKVLPSLKKLYAPSKEKPDVEVYEGKGGLKTVFNELLKHGKNFEAFGPTTNWKKHAPIELERYFKEREKIGFKARMLCPEGSDVLASPLNTYKFIPKQYSSPATTLMYGDKTCFVLWLDTIITILVKNKELSDSFRSYFNLMWQEQTKTLYGVEGLRHYFNDILKEKPKEFLVIGEAGRAADFDPEFWNEWDIKREKLGIKARRIYDDTLEARRAVKRHPQRKHREIKYMPFHPKTPLITVVYNNKVMLTSWKHKDLILVIIEDRDIANDFRQQFETLWNQKQHTYYGIEGVKNVLTQIIDEKPKEVFVYGTSGASRKIFPEFIKKWHEKRVKYRIKFKVIYTDSEDTKDRLKKLEKDPYYHVRLMPGGYESPVATFVYNNKVMLIAIVKNGFATVIEHDEITKIYRKQFDTLWKISKPVSEVEKMRRYSK